MTSVSRYFCEYRTWLVFIWCLTSISRYFCEYRTWLLFVWCLTSVSRYLFEYRTWLLFIWCMTSVTRHICDYDTWLLFVWCLTSVISHCNSEFPHCLQFLVHLRHTYDLTLCSQSAVLLLSSILAITNASHRTTTVKIITEQDYTTYVPELN